MVTKLSTEVVNHIGTLEYVCMLKDLYLFSAYSKFLLLYTSA